MTIKNKDGSLFQLNKPNPLMKTQSLWKDKYILHNCEWEPVAVEENVVLPTKEEVIPEQPTIVPVLEAPATSDGRIRVWCQPAQVREHVDKLYGQKFQRVKYGKKFLFEALVMEEDDLYMVLWTNTKAVTLGSVVYPQNQDKRWWRINSIEEKDGGYALMAIACEFTPEFSSQQ